MKKFVLLFCVIVMTLFVNSQDINAPSSTVNINLSEAKHSKPHCHAVRPMVFISINKSKTLIIRLDPSLYSSYTLTLTSSNDSCPIDIVPQNATVSIPITQTTSDYVLTIDGGDYGVYDGAFSGNGNDSITITDAMAMKIVKNRRESNRGVNFLVSSVDALINDGLRCRIDSMPSDAWAVSQQVKNLVFVDENPNSMWGHACSYYYTPRHVSSTDTLKVLSFNGILPPYGIAPSSVEMNTCYSISDFNTPPLAFQTALQERNVPNIDGTKYVIFGPPRIETGNTSEARLWNECSAMYTILVDKYNVNPEDIYVLMGNEDATMIQFSEQSYNYDTIPMPKDLDGDGLDENIIPSTSENVECLFNELGNQSVIGHFEHLFIFYAGFFGDEVINYEYGQYGERDVVLYFNESSMLASDLAEMIYRTDVSFVSSYFDPPIDSYFKLYLSKDHVVMGATGTYQLAVPYDSHTQYTDYNAFSFYWLSAAAEINLVTGQPLNVDNNNDSLISFDEISCRADSDFCEYFSSNPAWETYIGLRNIESSPQYLKDSLTFDYVPAHSLLKINKYESDSTIFWNTPDIWVRNQNDGTVHQESEHITIVEGEPVYIYVKVQNDGNLAHYPNNKKIILYAAPTSNCSNDPMNFTQEYVGDSIGEINVGVIAAGESSIFCYEWYWDNAMSDNSIDWGALFSNSGNMLPIRILALLGDDIDINHINNYNHIHPIPNYKLTLKKHVAVEPMQGVSFTGSNGMMMPFVGKRCKFSVPLDGNGKEPYSIEIIADSTKSSDNLFLGRTRIVLEPSADLLYAINNGGVTNSMSYIDGCSNKFKILADHACFSNLSFTGSIEMTVNVEVNTVMFSLVDDDYYFNIVLRDSTGNIIDGHTVHSFVEKDNSVVRPVTLAAPIGNGNYSLSEVNINEPASYEWYDAELNLFDNGKTVVADKSEVGELAVLKVTKASDGMELYAVASLDGVPAILSASPVPFDGYINVQLTDQAVAGMSLRIVPVVNAVSPIEQSIAEGSSSVVVGTSGLPAGQYVLSLMHNGSVIQSLNIYKNI